mgnify:FL=1
MLNKKTRFCFVTILFWFAVYAYVPQMPGYARQLGASYKMIGLITGAYGLTQTLLRIPLGIGSDMLGKRKIFIVIGSGVATLSALIVYLIPSPLTLLVARLLAGVSAATWVTFTVMYASYYPPLQATKAIGIIQSMNRIGMFTAMLVGGYLSTRFDIPAIFILSSVVGMLAMVASLSLEESSGLKNKRGFQKTDIPALLRNKNVMTICVLGAMSQMIMYGTTLGFTPIVAGLLGATNFQLSLLTMTFIFPQIIISLLSGTLFLRLFGERNTLLIGFTLMTIACLMTPLAPSLTLLFVLQLFSGIGNGIAFPLLTGLVIRDVAEYLRNTTMGFFQAFFGLGMILGPIILGFVSETWSLSYGFWTIGLIGIGSLIFLSRHSFNQAAQS